MTPAVTLDSTASMNARRVSSWVLAAAQRAGLLLEPAGHAVEGASPSVWISSSVSATGTRAEKSPSSIRPAAPTSCADRPHQPVGELQRGQDREPDDDQRAEQQRRVEPQLVGARSLRAATDSRCSTSLARSICSRNCGSNTRAA